MVFWRDYQIKHFDTYNHKRALYCSAVMSFDCETTTFFKLGNEWVVQNFNDDPKKYSEADKRVIPYIWQMGINDDIIYGREMSDFILFLIKFNKVNSATKIIYVHNLGFDFTHFCEYMPNDLKVFSKTAFKPMYVKSKSLGVEFRCSYMLTNMSLNDFAEQYNLSVKKLKGAMAYNVARTPLTKLDDKTEMLYCEFDVRVINAMIKEVYLPRYGTIAAIPLTQTGEVRRPTRKMLANSKMYMQKIKSMSPDLEQYKIAARYLMQGGYTHLNYFYNNVLLEDVDSYDISSSYPYVMCTQKFPMSKFMQCENYDRDKNYAYYMLVEFENILSCTTWNYIARHKVSLCLDGQCDNGKLQSAKKVIMWCVDVDFEIIQNNYTFEKCTIKECYKAFKNYLPLKLVNEILVQYCDKTTLKNIPEKYVYYLQQKQKLNSQFGNMATNTIRFEYGFDSVSKEWIYPDKNDMLDDDKIAEKIENSKPFLNYFWGIWVLAFARFQLWKLLTEINKNNFGLDSIYCDTDSIKMLNAEKHLNDIKAFNVDIDNTIDEVCRVRGLNKSMFYPLDIKGKTHPLGHFEFDGHYKKFKSLGSKKYCYIDDKDEFHAVVAGLRKEYIDVDGVHKTLTSIDQMNLDERGIIKNARSVHWYLNNQKPVVVKDRNGVEYMAFNKKGIAIINTNYTFSTGRDYEKFLDQFKGVIFEGWNDYTNRFNIC